MAPAPTKAQLVDLFPVPGKPLTLSSATRWPGASLNSTDVLRDYLKRDYVEHHGFFNYTPRGAHNHTPFHLLVKWALGGGTQHLDAVWEQHEITERYAFKSPAPITEANALDHLGDREYYQAYLHFYSELLLKKSTTEVLEEWVFSPKANLDGPNGKTPEMVNRLVDGILHPMLYLGYGIEFSVPGLIAEGLAQTSVHLAISSNLVPRSLLDAPSQAGPGTSAFTILSRIINDPAFANFKNGFDDLQKNLGVKIQSYTSEWLVDGASEQVIAKKVQEVSFMNVLLYAVGGWRDGVGFYNGEFTLMHLLTSSMTMTPYMAVLSSPKSKSIFLRAYFTRSIAYYINQGRPPLPIRSFFSAPILTSFPGPTANPTESAFPSPDSPYAETPNVWLKIIQSTLVHPDDHLCKVNRTLAHFDTLYGHLPAGEYKGTALRDADMIDGTLFVRSAALTMEWMGRIREGEPARFWGDDPNFLEARIS